LRYEPAEGISRFLTGTPSVLALSAMECGIDLVADASVDALRRKSVLQTDLLHALWRERLRHLGFTFNSPDDSAVRGSHISLGHEEAWRIDLALIQMLNVLPDFRAPDNLRLGIAPLYTRYVDIFDAVERMERTVVERLYENYPRQTTGVT
jgi:kynureninase